MTSWYQDGQLLTNLPIDDRAFQYGDGLFETIAIRAGRPRFWSFHVDRLALGCARLKLNMPNEKTLLQGVLHALQQANACEQHGVVKILLSAGVAKRGYTRTTGVEPRVLFGVFDAKPAPANAYRIGVDTMLCQTRLASPSVTAGLKTLNRLEQVLARTELSDTVYFEGFTMDAEHHIICGTMSNVFFAKDNIVGTPSLDRCGVAGVMRRWVIATLAAQDIEVQERRFKAGELSEIDEVFLTNSQFGVLPVRRCGTHNWSVGQVTKRLMASLQDYDRTQLR